jgi:brefeldin A-inhibited guanine nucleotide-exchange protein
MENFKDHLKSELEVFVTNIFLRILESENSPYEHKLRVMDVFHNIINDPTALVEIFINFDCDFEAIDLFRRIIDAFSKIAKISNMAQSKAIEFMTSRKTASEEHNIRSKCCEGLVIILKSIKSIAGISIEQDCSPEVSQTSGAGNKSGSRRSSMNAEIPSADSDNGVDVVDENDDSNTSAGTMKVFDRKQKIQEEIETGILKFNLSAKKGIAYLVGLGHIEHTPTSVSNFFRQYQDRLDKTAIGEYLGREREYENGFCLKVLHEYVDSMDFTNMKFDMAIRAYLSGFRLPGEAQKN